MNPTRRPAVRPLPAEAPLPMNAALDQLADHARTGVTVVCGFPASGKSTAARYLADITNAVIIDKDAFAPDLEESIMAELTGNPFDRDSASYMRVVNPHIYSAFIHQAFVVANHVPVIVDAPFIGHVQAAAGRGLSLRPHLFNGFDNPASDPNGLDFRSSQPDPRPDEQPLRGERCRQTGRPIVRTSSIRVSTTRPELWSTKSSGTTEPVATT
ncbi:AAA family ATPase [Nocardia tengchongensis]|uniref:AAA family ATPase n=1 Tax=Nocardia tengchongensis TaxID=2055889 RepID=UPI00367AFD0D